MRNLSKLMLGAGLVVASLASVMGTEAKAQVNFVAPQQSSVSASSTLTTTTRIGQIRSATSSAAIEIQLPAHNYYYSGNHTLDTTVTPGAVGVDDYISNINLQSDAPTVFAARPAISAAAAIDPNSFEAGAVAAFGTATDADKVALIESWRRGDTENAPFYAVPQESSGSGVATQTTVARQGDVRTRSVSSAIEVQLPSESAYFDTSDDTGIAANLDVTVSNAGTLGVTIDQLAFDPGLATEYTAFAPVATPIAANSFEGTVSAYVAGTTSSNASAAIEAWQTGGLD